MPRTVVWATWFFSRIFLLFLLSQFEQHSNQQGRNNFEGNYTGGREVRNLDSAALITRRHVMHSPVHSTHLCPQLIQNTFQWNHVSTFPTSKTPSSFSNWNIFVACWLRSSIRWLNALAPVKPTSSSKCSRGKLEHTHPFPFPAAFWVKVEVITLNVRNDHKRGVCEFHACLSISCWMLIRNDYNAD